MSFKYVRPLTLVEIRNLPNNATSQDYCPQNLKYLEDFGLKTKAIIWP